MDEFEIRNKVSELTSYIASNWPSVEERKHLYMKRERLEMMLKELKNGQGAEDKQEKDKKA